MRLTRTATALAAALGGSGVLHLVRPRTFEPLVPPELGDARAWVHASGVAEIGTAALLVAFVPAHLHTFRVVPRRALPMTIAAVRLPLQVPLIRVALGVARGRAR